MWINRRHFIDLQLSLGVARDSAIFERTGASRLSATCKALSEQKAKDDITLDWMRHRVNAVEKLNAQLLNKVAGIHIPVPEIVPTRPGSITDRMPDYDSIPDFEDVGDKEAARLGAKHDDAGNLEFTTINNG